MKKVTVTYTETYIVTNEKEIIVSNAMFKKLQDETSEEYQKLLLEMDADTCVLDTHTERDKTFMDISETKFSLNF